MIKNKDSYKWWVLITVSISNLLATVDISVLGACLPHFAETFQTDSSVISWVIIAYFIMSQSIMLTFSKIADVKGRKKIFIIAISIYCLGLLIASLSQSIFQLIFSRIVQGAAGATINALALAITVAIFPSDERGKALGIVMGTSSIGLVSGPAFGGIILDFLGWKAVFYTRIPFMIISLIIAWAILEEQKRYDSQSFKFDLIGSITLFGWLTCFLLLLSLSSRWSFFSAPSLLLVTMTVILFIIFLIWENRTTEPIIDLRLFKNRVFSLATLTCIIATMGTSSTSFLIPFYLMEGFGSSGTEVSFYLVCMATPSILVSPLSGRLSDKIGTLLLTTIAIIISSVGLLFLIQMDMEKNIIFLFIGVVLIGTGIATFHPPNNSAIVGSVSKDMLGVASAIGAGSRNIGASISTSISGVLYSAYKSSHLANLLHDGFDSVIAEKIAAVSSFSDTITVTFIFTLIAIVTSLLRGPVKRDSSLPNFIR